jgi:hypothetical protein
MTFKEIKEKVKNNINGIVKILYHPNKKKEYKTPHYKLRVKERGVMDCSVEYILGHFICEYGFKDLPNSIPKPLLKPNRRAFLVQGRGLQAVVYIIDASGDTAALVTAIAIPHDEWGVLPKRFCQNWVSASRKKK